MPFPSSKDGSPPAPRIKSGGRRSNKYAIYYVMKEDDSKDPDNWYYTELSSTSVSRVHNAVLKELNETEDDEGQLPDPPFKKTEVDIMSATVMNPPKGVEV